MEHNLPAYTTPLKDHPEITHQLPPEEAETAYVRRVVCMDCKDEGVAVFVPNAIYRVATEHAVFWDKRPGKIWFMCPSCNLEWSDYCGNYDNAAWLRHMGVMNVIGHSND